MEYRFPAGALRFFFQFKILLYPVCEVSRGCKCISQGEAKTALFKIGFLCFTVRLKFIMPDVQIRPLRSTYVCHSHCWDTFSNSKGNSAHFTHWLFRVHGKEFSICEKCCTKTSVVTEGATSLKKDVNNVLIIMFSTSPQISSYLGFQNKWA